MSLLKRYFYNLVIIILDTYFYLHGFSNKCIKIYSMTIYKPKFNFVSIINYLFRFNILSNLFSSCGNYA
jgi:hypothetical protein